MNKIKLLLTGIVIIALSLVALSRPEQGNRIELKSQNYILGPAIKLGDIAFIKLKNQYIVNELKEINLGLAAPPGEAKEISRSFIRAKIRETSFSEYAKCVNGPRMVAVNTIPDKLRNMFMHEGIACSKRVYFEVKINS